MTELPKIVPLSEQKSRRAFLKGALLAATATATGCSTKDPFTQAGENAAQATGEKVKLLSTSG